MKKIIVIGLLVIVVGLFAYYLTQGGGSPNLTSMPMSGGRPAVPAHPTLTGVSVASNSDENAIMSVDVLQSSGIVDIQDKADISILGPAKFHFVFTKIKPDSNCIFGYGHNISDGKYTVPFLGKFEATVETPVSAAGDYYVVCKNSDGNWGEYLYIGIHVFDPKVYPGNVLDTIPFINLPGSKIPNL